MSVLLHKERLERVAPLLSRSLVIAIESWDDEATWIVAEGLRDVATQRLYVARSKSRTMHSLHLEGRAVDVYRLIHGGRVVDMQPRAYSLLYRRLLDQLDAEGADRHHIVWGGVWRLGDYGHYELH